MSSGSVPIMSLMRQVSKPVRNHDDEISAPPLKRQLTRAFDKDPIGESLGSSTGFLSGGDIGSVGVLMVGTGEYTTGYVHGKGSDSDKSAGVVALTMFDLRKRGKLGDTCRLALCGVNGNKFPGIRQHMQSALADKYEDFDISVETFPADDECDPLSYVKAIKTFKRGDIAIVFTPDDTHFDIAMAAINQGMHVLVTKPVVKTLEEHHRLHEAAEKNGVLVSVEVHKRWDPIYHDARDRIQALGNFSYLYSYMSQPKHQLETFKAWAGRSSDISYYLNSHHIDFHEWCVGETARPILVHAMASTGVAKEKFDMDCEDTITLTVQWENMAGASRQVVVVDSHIIATH